ncbi:MAG: hypothetical protein LBF22_02425 [Deltaproteobacteria bacterium]|jgi:hypothetical protein|nr:hypothetical protein [Deltaproteobacteria bacterium]
MSASLQAQVKKPEDVFTVKDESWVLKSGEEATGLSGANQDGTMFWYAVSPEDDDAAKGMKPGVLIYDIYLKKYTFLPLEPVKVFVDNVYFSSNKKMAVVASRMSRYESLLSVFDFETQALRHTISGYSEIYLVNNNRFVFTLLNSKLERPSEAGLWGKSVAIYDPKAEKGYDIIKEATTLESFEVMSVEGDKITINVTYVPSEKDWDDFDKQKETQLVVKVPN